MNKSLLFNNIALGICGIAALLTACEDQSDEITEISYSRLFGASQIKATVMSQTSLRLTWTQVGDVDYYNLQIGTDSAEIESNLFIETTLTTSPTTLTDFAGDTQYYGRMQSVKDGETSSNWVWFSFKTDTEQRALSSESTDITANEALLRWEAGIEVTSIVLTEDESGEVIEDHTLTDDEIEEGIYQFEGLTGTTDYTAILYKEEAVRASWSFTTLMDLGDAFGVYLGDDLKALVDSVDEDGNYLADEFIIVDQGDYVVGSWTISRSVTIRGYNPLSRPTIHGAVWNGNTTDDDAVTFEFTDIIFDGAEYNYTDSEGEANTMSQEGQVFVVKATGEITSVTFDGCLIKNYSKGVCYDNVGATIGDIVINDCVCDSIEGNGGGTFDFRTGSLGSLTVTNSTFMNGGRDFTRIASGSNTVTTFSDCTFFRICNYDNSNNSGLIRQTSGTFTMTNCIVDQLGTVDGETYLSYGFWTKSSSNYAAEFSYSNVYYSNSENIWTGYLTSAPDGVSELSTGVGLTDEFDLTSDGTIDITLQSEDYIGVECGDPRWYYAN